MNVVLDETEEVYDCAAKPGKDVKPRRPLGECPHSRWRMSEQVEEHRVRLACLRHVVACTCDLLQSRLDAELTRPGRILLKGDNITLVQPVQAA